MSHLQADDSYKKKLLDMSQMLKQSRLNFWVSAGCVLFSLGLMAYLAFFSDGGFWQGMLFPVVMLSPNVIRGFGIKEMIVEHKARLAEVGLEW